MKYCSLLVIVDAASLPWLIVVQGIVGFVIVWGSC